MPTPNQQTSISSAISAIRSAESILTSQIRAAVDPLIAIKLTHEFQNIDSVLSQLLHAQSLADDLAFSTATAALKAQVNSLKADEATIKGIVNDVATATTIVGYIAQALAFIAML